MRFLLSRVIATAAAVALSTGGVSGLTVCYPGCGSSDYASFGSTLTPFTQTISLPKFDSANGDRTLQKVTISAKAYFQTQFYMKCTADTTTCSSTFTGTTSAGVKFGINPSSTNTATLRTNLPQYWGRWGDYRLSDPSTQYNMALRTSKDGSGNPFFIEYTYPFFDIPGFVEETSVDQPNKVWAYLLPDTQQSRLFYDTDETSYDSSNGIVVTYANAAPIDESYSSAQYTSGSPKVLTYGQGGTATPFDTEVLIGTFTFDATSTPYTKSINLDDFSGTDGGGIGNNITPETMLALFTDSTSSNEQIVWDVDATGFVTVALSGGNYQARQETTGYAQMQIQYDYIGPAITEGDPHFSGFQGQSFQVHGYPGSYFHLISAPQFQMNGRFAYIANGHCNYNHTACWTHPGTYIDDIAIVVDELLVRITAGAVGQGYSVRINDEPFHAHAHAHGMGMNETSHIDIDTDIHEFVPTKFYDAATRLTIHLLSPLQISIRTELFALTIHNADHFFNIDSQILVRPILTMGREASTKYPHPTNGKPWFPHFPIHGFIGQTWAKATYNNNKQYQGDVDDYLETRPYATESIYSQYFKKFDDKTMNWDN